MINREQTENETGGIADASVDASFNVSVSNRGSGAGTQHNCPYPPDPFRTSGKCRRVCFPAFGRNLLPSKHREALTQRHSAVSRRHESSTKCLRYRQIKHQTPAGTHHTNSPSAHHLRDTNASVKRFLLLPTVAFMSTVKLRN
jgi:hypothetical protein